ncbi:MAG TPA: hypothetical protein VGJ26_12360 [Pirellulales bacterium]
MAIGSAAWGIWGLITFDEMDGIYGLLGILLGIVLGAVGATTIIVSLIEPNDRYWFQFGLGRLLVALSLCAVSFGAMRLAVRLEQFQIFGYPFFVALALGLGSIVCFAVAGGVLLRIERLVGVAAGALAVITFIAYVMWEVVWAQIGS